MPLISGSMAALLNREAAAEATKANITMNRENNAFNAEQAALQRSFEEKMSNTAIQRKKEDLIAAGLNPMLAVENGGASTPATSAASSSNFSGAHAANYNSIVGAENGLAKLASSAYAVHQIKKVVGSNPMAVAALKGVAPAFLKAATNAKAASIGLKLLKLL